MKIALVLVLCLAGFMDDLKNAFSNIGSALTTTVHAVGDQTKFVGQNLLSTAKEQGSQLASQALQSLLMGTMNALSQPSTTDTATGAHGDAIHASTSQLAQHGQEAPSALKDAVTDILQQTLTNMQPQIVNILQHGSQALTETLSHTGTSETASNPQ